MSAYNFTKLFSSITESTIWCEPAGTRLVWITMLAKCDRHGIILASIPGLARLANVTLPECEEAIRTLLSPDPYSRTPDNDGVRIEVIDGGWRLLNHAKYRDMRDDETRREQNREAQRRHRERMGMSADSADSKQGVSNTPPKSAHADTDADAELSTDTSTTPPPSALGGSFEGQGDGKATPNPAAPLAIALNKAGFKCTSYTPALIAYAGEGGTLEHLLQVLAVYGADNTGKPASYLLSIARRELTERANPVTPGAASNNRYTAPPPARTTETVEQTRAKRDAAKPVKPADPETAARAIEEARKALAMPEPATRAKPAPVSRAELEAAEAELLATRGKAHTVGAEA